MWERKKWERERGREIEHWPYGFEIDHRWTCIKSVATGNNSFYIKLLTEQQQQKQQQQKQQQQQQKNTKASV